MPQQLTPEERVAYHEAGHAVAAVALQAKFTYVSLEDGPTGSVLLIQDPPDEWTPDSMARELDRAIDLRLAGLVTETIAAGDAG